MHSGYDVVCLDNFSNSSPEAIKRVEKIAGKRVTTVTGDVRDREVMSRVFKRPIDGVIHFAALKAVGESVSQPVDYYGNNVGGTLALLDAMHERKVQRLRVQFVGDCLRRARQAAAGGGRAGTADQPVRPHQGDGRADPARLVRRRR